MIRPRKPLKKLSTKCNKSLIHSWVSVQYLFLFVYSSLDLVTNEEEKFREIERRHIYDSRTGPKQHSALTNFEHFDEANSKPELSSVGNVHNHPLGYGSLYSAGNNFDDVASIRTEPQYKLSSRDHQMMENHIFSQSQSRDSLPLVSNPGAIGGHHFG